MKPEHEKYRKLAHFLLVTRPDEITCDEWLDRVAAYVELSLSGQPIPAQFCEMERHMRMCPECSEEHQALIEALREGE